MKQSVTIFFTAIWILSCKESINNFEKQYIDSVNRIVEYQINPLLANSDENGLSRILDSVKPFFELRENGRLQFLIVQSLGKVMVQDYDSARHFIENAAGLVRDTNSIYMLKVNDCRITILIEQKKWDSALHFASRTYHLAKKVDQAVLLPICYKLLEINDAMGNTEGAQKYAFEGFERGIHDPYFRAVFANSIAKYYEKAGKIDSAITFFEKMNQYEDITNDTSFYGKHLEAVKNENLGVLYTKKNNLEKALHFLSKAVPLNKALGTYDAQSMYNLAEVYTKLSQHKKALSFLDSAFSYADSINNYELQRQILKLRSDNYDSLKEYGNSLKSLYAAYALYKVEIDSSVAQHARELETVYSVKAKDDQIAFLGLQNEIRVRASEQQRMYIIALVIILLLITVIGLLLYRRRQTQNTIRESELLQQLFASQMDSHFAFNSLTTLQNLILEGNIEKSNNYLIVFSRLLQLIMQNSQHPYIKLDDEVTLISDYLAIQAINHENKFQFEISVPQEVETEEILIPPMLLQPFIENSIVHGFATITYNGLIKIVIQVDKGNKLIYCNIDDNGSGLGRNSTEQTKRDSSTFKIRKRLQLLSRRTGSTSFIKLMDKDTEAYGSGVRVELGIPFKSSF